MEEIVVRVKFYVDLEITKEVRKAQNESNKEIQKGKKNEQQPHKNKHREEKYRPMVPLNSREVYETYTPLDQEISIILNKMEKID